MTETKTSGCAARILVVDDTSANLQLLTNLLTEQGYTVHPASDGELALEFVRTTLPDLILLDIRMPGMDGYEVCRRLKADERTDAVPVIFISVLEDEHDKVRGFREGAVDYINKPFRQEEVLARIQTHLRLRELTERLEQKVAERTADLQREMAERRRLESELRSSRDFLSNVINAIADPVFVKDAEHRLVLVNDAECALAGASREELLGKTDYDFFPREQVDVFWRIDDQVLADGELNVNEEQITDATGRVRTIVTHKSRYVDLQGNRFVVGGIRDITERKRMEEQLWVREQQFRTLVENSPDFVSRYDREGRRTFVNPPMEKLFGRTASEMVGSKPTDMSPLLEPELFEQKLRELWQSRREFQAELPFTTARGEIRWCHFRVVPEFGPDGTVASALAIGRDITAIKEVERQLRETRGRLSAMFTTIPDLVWLKDKEGIYLACNPAFERFFGATEAEIIGKTDHDFVNAELADFFVLKDREAIAARKVCVNEEEITYAADGCRGILETRKVPVCDADGRVVGVLGIARDITGRKQAEALLCKREQEFRALVENSPDFIARYDEQCRRVYVNPAMEKLFERPAEELLGRRPSDMSPLAKTAYFEQLLRQVRCHGRECQAELPFRTAQGETRWCHFRIVPEFDAAGTVLSTLAIGRDISAVKEAEKSLRASERRFREIFDNSLDCLYLLEVTEDGRFRNLEINPAAERSFGMLRAELIGRCVDETVPEETARTVVAKYRRCVEAGTATEEEAELDLPSGRRYYHSTLIPVRDDTGRIYRIIGITCDITERKHFEIQLQRRERQYRDLSEEFQTLLNGIPDLIIHLNPDLTIIWANKAAREYNAVDLKGQLCYTVFHDRLAPCENCPAVRAFAGGAIEGEVILDKKGRYWGIKVFPLKGGDGRVVSVIDYACDITERIRINEVLNLKRDQLAAVTLELSLAEERERMRIASELHDHLGQILLLGRIKLGSLADSPLEKQVRTTIEETRELLEQATRETHSLTVQLNPPILAVSGLEAALEWLGKRMEADYDLRVEFFNDMKNKNLIEEVRNIVYQCGRELLINVAKHAKTGHARLIIERKDDLFVLTVEDEGQGFDPSALVPDTSKDCRYGLFSVQIKIERLGGRFLMDSAPGRGSRMTLQVPLAVN